MKVVTVSFGCKDEDAEGLEHELNNLNMGLYHFGTSSRDADSAELAEIRDQVPPEYLDCPPDEEE